MCGRFILGVVREELERLVDEYYDIDGIGGDIVVPRYNVAPGQNVIAVVGSKAGNRIGALRWGLVPPYAKDEKAAFGMINARAETLAEKPLFAASLARRRCLILADGFYEWKKEGSAKIPMRIFLKDASLFAMAGIWTTFVRPDGTKLYSCAIVTTAANALMKPIHERMPVILPRAHQGLWLGPETDDLARLASLLEPYDAAAMDAHAVSVYVNDARHDDPACILRA